jgi:hypothetical protein
MFSVRLTAYATVLLAVSAVVFSYNAIDHWKNFKEVTAVIDDVNHKCHREGSTLGEFWKAEPQALRDCKTAELTAAKGTPIPPCNSPDFFGPLCFPGRSTRTSGKHSGNRISRKPNANSCRQATASPCPFIKA